MARFNMNRKDSQGLDTKGKNGYKYKERYSRERINMNTKRENLR